jgi:hypothetical protein
VVCSSRPLSTLVGGRAGARWMWCERCESFAVQTLTHQVLSLSLSLTWFSLALSAQPPSSRGRLLACQPRRFVTIPPNAAVAFQPQSISVRFRCDVLLAGCVGRLDRLGLVLLCSCSCSCVIYRLLALFVLDCLLVVSTRRRVGTEKQHNRALRLGGRR